MRVFGLCLALVFSFHSFAEDKAIDFKALGFDEQTTQSNAQEGDLLKVRAHKLQRHQLMGYVTLGLVLATVFSGPEGAEPSDFHKYIGMASFASYAYTGYLSLTAPELSTHEYSRWGMRIHKALVWVHIPAMILTPIAGIMAERSYERGEKPTGLGKYKKDLAYAAAASLGISALAVTFEF